MGISFSFLPIVLGIKGKVCVAGVWRHGFLLHRLGECKIKQR